MLHRKKLLALALVAAAGVPVAAGAQSASVTIYGKLYPEMVWGKASGGTSPGTTVSTLSPNPTGGETPNIYSVQSSNSRLGIRGQEKIGSDLRAIFQLEQTVPIDTGGGVLGNRDSFLGLGSEHWGTVKLGNFDTVYKNLGDTLSFLGVSSGNFVSNSNVLSKSPLGTSSSASFHLRRANSVQYESPDYRGFGVLAQYSPDEAKTPTRNAYLVSLGAKYENGPLYVAIAGEQHRDLFGGSRNARSSQSNFADQNARSKDRAVRATVKYEFANTFIEADIARLEWKETGGASNRFQSYKHNTYLISADHRIGPWRFAAAFTWGDSGSCSLFGGADCSTDGLEGNQGSIGASYALSRRTQLFAIASRVTNGKSARYINADWLAEVTPGMDINQVAVGIAHSF